MLNRKAKTTSELTYTGNRFKTSGVDKINVDQILIRTITMVDAYGIGYPRYGVPTPRGSRIGIKELN